MQRLSKYEYIFLVTLDKELNDQLLKACLAQGVSKTKMVRTALAEYFYENPGCFHKNENSNTIAWYKP